MKEESIAVRAGGPVVKDWGTHFLRDDTEIRKRSGGFDGEEEAYSLFRVNPYGRVEVFRGPKEWALTEAEKHVPSA